MTLVPVLMYHAVGRPCDERFRRWVVSPSLLAEQLAAIREAGYNFSGLTQWADQGGGEHCVVLTFDDGYVDFIEYALPLLTASRAHATVYVVTGHIGGWARWLPFGGERTRPIMTWDHLHTIRSHGIEIGSHGHRHIELDAVQPAVAQADVRSSRDALMEHGFAPRSFCYPFGYTNRRVRDIVAGEGFTTACVVGRGLADSGEDKLQVRRLEIDHRTSPEALLRRFQGPGMQGAARIREAAQPTWRLMRRVRSVARGSVNAEVFQ
jgi:peptidoglycan/xylan/chitin deacetylase (PgdA/CDA1 family)